jgi:hypothetical protein
LTLESITPRNIQAVNSWSHLVLRDDHPTGDGRYPRIARFCIASVRPRQSYLKEHEKWRHQDLSQEFALATAPVSRGRSLASAHSIRRGLLRAVYHQCLHRTFRWLQFQAQLLNARQGRVHQVRPGVLRGVRDIRPLPPAPRYAIAASKASRTLPGNSLGNDVRGILKADESSRQHANGPRRTVPR